MNDIILFKKNGKDYTFEDLLRKIYDNAEEKQKNIIATVDHIKPLIKTINDAVIIMPNLVNLQSVSVKNDEQLIKMAAIVKSMYGKRSTNIETEEDSLLGDLTESQRNEILKSAGLMPGEGK